MRHPKKVGARVAKEGRGLVLYVVGQGSGTQERNDIVESRQQKLDMAMTVKSDWDMKIDYQRL